MSYQKITTCEEDAISNLIPLFKQSTVKDLVSITGDRYQDLANTLHDIYNARFLDRATGISLDYLGAQVGQPRPLYGPATTDNKYRALIKARIAANRSNGTLPEIYNILGFLGAKNIIAEDVPNAAMRINIQGDFLLSLQEILTTLIGATAPISLEINSYSDHFFGFLEDSESFGFDDGELGDSVQI